MGNFSKYLDKILNESKKLIINIKSKDDGYVCVADNGDLPFEGRVHKTKEDAIKDLDSAYNNKTWQGKKLSNNKYQIIID